MSAHTQPHGVLVAVDDHLTVVMVSTNLAALLGHEPDAAVGQRLADLVGATVADLVAGRMARGCPDEPLATRLDEVGGGALAGTDVDVHLHRSGARTVVEVEPVASVRQRPMTYRSARSAMGRLAESSTVVGLGDQLAREVRTLTGFDRVTVHRFHDGRDGEVVAEDRRPDLGSFLGLQQPDQARPRKFSGLCLVADVAHAPVALTPELDPGTRAPLDLSHATLRSVTPLHQERLRQLGVTAAMTVPLLVEGEPWGLVACHHYSGSRRPPPDARSAALFLAEVASPMIADRERAEDREAALSTQSLLADLTARVSASPASPLEALISDPVLRVLMDAGGVAMNFDGVIRTVGVVPADEDLVRIAALTDDPHRYATHTDHLAGIDPALASMASVVAGVLRIGASPDRWLLWLRPETEQAASGHSHGWAPWELDAAEVMGRHVNGLLLLRSREQIAMAESMQRNVVLDRAPDFAGVDLVARYRPASTYQLGGDWWDAFELPDGRLALVIGDVAGHGVSAASAMTQVRTALRAYLFEGHGAASCLDQLDRLMDALLDPCVATAVVVLLDVATGHAEIANAGHPPLLITGPAGVRDVAEATRPLLGVGVGAADAVSVHLRTDETLVLYTDGLVERRGHDIEERTERLRALVTSTSAAEPLDRLADRVLVLQDGTEDDDTTLLAVRRVSGGGPGSPG